MVTKVASPPSHSFATHHQTTTSHHSNYYHGPTWRQQPSVLLPSGPARRTQLQHHRRAGHGINLRPFSHLPKVPQASQPSRSIQTREAPRLPLRSSKLLSMGTPFPRRLRVLLVRQNPLTQQLPLQSDEVGNRIAVSTEVAPLL